MGSTADQLSTEELRQQLDTQRSEIGQDLAAIGDRVSPRRVAERRTAAVRGRVGDLRDAVMGAKDSVADQAAGAGGQVGGAVSAVADRASAAASEVQGVPQAARERAQGNPVAAGFIAFGAGLLAASLVPASRREQQVVAEHVQPQLDQAAGRVGTAAQETVEAVRPAAEDAVTELQGEAQEAVAEVKDRAAGAATDVADGAEQKADEVRS